MRKFLTLLLAFSLIFSLAACGSKTGTGNEGANKAELPKIGVTIYKFDDNFMSFVRRAIENEAKGKAELILNDSQNNQATQNEQVDMMISKGVKALAINLVDPQAAPTIISKAKQENIPIIFFNKEPSEEAMKSYDKAWYVGTTSSQSGVIQGQLIAKAWKAHPEWDKNGDGKMQYVMLKGEPGHPDAEARTKYSIETIVAEGIEVEQLELQTGMWDTVKGKELMDAWLSKHGDNIEFVIANNDAMALGALQSLQANGYFEGDKFMPVVGVDAIPDALEQIKKGLMVGTVLNDAKNQGKATLELALNVANGKDPLEGTEWKLDDKKAVRVPYVAITKDNIEVAEEAYK
ncbi:methyl-galactoside transport system substrate-binding protein [Caminicella sporogenes DSM 14501]|uniref:D-galactose/methyl-galactoside binding periplasmic protein MglB n=1 Tax=Caminicella sporogenes DSM 14501 TaxID=1121266 RepID=A0A1M6NL54_9FIRM|nr:galactose/glucose ABC transporter substrate-binding protein MglB [Caminicella sporogenes]RKD22169.1 galactose ABC transporter substrate-binding protein [Caminicella sporogenes]SHJ96294.1 methyl-galactoside transport system substrate-binding protein [Caminicella sporogenes DSM 14501]